jgi:hypothetical protein
VRADDKSKIALQPDPAFTWTLTGGRVVAGDTPAGALTRAPGEAPGAYAITRGTFSYGPNYTLTFIDGVLAIQPLPAPALPPTVVAGQTTPGLPGMPAETADPSMTRTMIELAQNPACQLNSSGTLICGGF